MNQAEPLPAAPLRQALARLLRVARGIAALCRRAPQPALAQPAPAEPPRRIHPGYTLARTTELLAALASTLAGDHFFCRPIALPPFPARYPSLTADLRRELGLPAVPPRTEAQRAASRLCYLRRVFETQATGRIAIRLARRLRLTPADPAWPHALAAIATPPAKLARAARPACRPGRKPRQSRFPFPLIKPLVLPMPPLRRHNE